MDFLREVACLQHDSHSVLFPHCSQPLITGRMQIAPDCRVLKARYPSNPVRSAGHGPHTEHMRAGGTLLSTPL